jgi:hypothetical protein
MSAEKSCSIFNLGVDFRFGYPRFAPDAHRMTPL